MRILRLVKSAAFNPRTSSRLADQLLEENDDRDGEKKMSISSLSVILFAQYLK